MTTVEKIKAKILDLAIRGKLVPQNPDDEPASVLLGRIKAEKAKLVKAGKIKKDKNPSEIVVGSDGTTYEKFADGKEKDISDELPFDLPQSWVWVKLANVSSTINSKSHQILESDIIPCGRFPVVSQGRNRIDGYCNQTDKVLSEVPVILFGDHTRVVKFIDYPFIVGADGTKLFKPLTNPKWLYYWTTYASTTSLQSRGYGRHWNLLNLIFIPLPPLAEQKRIVAKIEELFAYADKIGKVSDGIALTAQRLDKRILDLAIRGQLVPQDPNDEPASELIKRIEAAKKATEKGRKSSRAAASDRPAYETNPPFDIPDSWEWVRLGDVLLPMETKRPQGEEFQYIDIDAIDNTNNVVLTPKRLPVTNAPSRASRGLKSGDTLFSVVRPYLRNIAYIDDSLADCIASTGFYVCRPDEMVAPRFLFWLLLSDYVVNGLNSFMKGDNSPSIRGEQLHDFLVPLPPVTEQKRIVAKIEELRAMTRSFTK